MRVSVRLVLLPLFGSPPTLGSHFGARVLDTEARYTRLGTREPPAANLLREYQRDTED